MQKELKLENKFVYLAFAAGALYYLAYYFRFPNTYSFILSFILLTLLIRNFNKIEGLRIIIYSLIISLVTLAPSLTAGSYSLLTNTLLFSINLIILLAMIFGLKSFKKWTFYFSIVMISLSSISMILSIIAYDANYFAWTIQNMMLNLKMIAAISLWMVSIAFLIKFRKSFSSKKLNKK